MNWLTSQKIEHAEQRIAFEEMLLAAREAQARIARLEQAIRAALPDWSLTQVVTALMAMRGFDLVAATAFQAEIGDLSRFATPRELMDYLGLMPSEHSTGDKVKRAGITKAGNGGRDAFSWSAPGAIGIRLASARRSWQRSRPRREPFKRSPLAASGRPWQPPPSGANCRASSGPSIVRSVQAHFRPCERDPSSQAGHPGKAAATTDIVQRTLVAEVLGVQEGELGPDSSMDNTPSWDSVEHANIYLTFEQRFGVALDMDAIDAAVSIRSLAAQAPEFERTLVDAGTRDRIRPNALRRGLKALGGPSERSGCG